MFAGNIFLKELHSRVIQFIRVSLVEGQKYAVSSKLWSLAKDDITADLLITINSEVNNEHQRSVATWLVDVIKLYEPGLTIEVRYHQLTDCYALYITADYLSLLKGAELCHIHKPIKKQFGGGSRQFTFLEVQSFLNVENKQLFFTQIEKSMIVKQIIDMIRAPNEAISIKKILESSATNPMKLGSTFEGRTLIAFLQANNIIGTIIPLHQREILKRLQQEWLFNVFNEQPIDKIKDYFGTEIAMYFAWLSHLTAFLCAPAAMALLMFFISGFEIKTNIESDDKESSLFTDICFVVFAFFNCVWSSTYLEFWKRKQAELAFKWGTYDLEMESILQEPRSKFKGDSMKPNPVSGRQEPYYPGWKYFLIKYGFSLPITCISVIMLLCFIFIFIQLQTIAEDAFGESTFFSWITYLPIIAQAITTLIADKLYRYLAVWLNDFENHRIDADYEQSLILKIVIFQCVSAFASLFYIAFYLKDMIRLQETLATLLVTRQLTQNFAEITVPFIMKKLRFCQLAYKVTKSRNLTTLEGRVNKLKKNFENSNTSQNDVMLKRYVSVDSNYNSPRLPIPEYKIEEEKYCITENEIQSLMNGYERPLDDYLEMFIQFGYVLFFSPAFSLAAVCALINNFFEIRVDAFKLCNTVQRPFGRIVKNIGAWQKLMEIMGIAGVIVNCALIGQSCLMQRLFPDLSTVSQVLVVVIMEHIFLGARLLMDSIIPDTPHWVQLEISKMEHVKKEMYKKNSLLSQRKSSSNNIHNFNNTTLSPNSTQLETKRPKLLKRFNSKQLRSRRSCTPNERIPFLNDQEESPLSF
uniref:Anoctamin n=1 Tax=Rhabditophanes sp. KR3021 TaxID=114890 RepID=A0AC35U6K4_9BILA